MHKISQEIKRSKLPNHVAEHLNFFPSFQVRFIIGVFTFVMLDFIIFVPLIVPPIKILIIVLLPLLTAVSVWALWLLVRKTQYTELETILFLGCLGAVGSLAYFCVGLKYSFLLGITHSFYYMITIFFYAAAIFFFFRYYHHKFSSLKEKEEKETPKWHNAVAAIAVPSGYIMSHYLMKTSHFLMVSLITLIFFALSFTYIFLFAKYIHKYLFIRANLHFVRFFGKKYEDYKQEVKHV